MKRLREGGFTLIEIAIALVVLGLLIAGLLGPMSTRVEQAERERTRAMLEEIKEALYGFAIAQGRLPCPDSDGDGQEDPAGGCDSGPLNYVVGNLPWVDLAVPEEDAWGRRFRYGVTKSYADAISQDTVQPPPPPGPPTPPCTTLPAQASFALCSDGNIKIRDGDDSISGTTEIATKVPAVVVSHGKHRFDPTDLSDPPSPHEDENFEDSRPGDVLRTFVSRDYTGGTGEEFDDLVVWISPLILKNRMIMAGKLP